MQRRAVYVGLLILLILGCNFLARTQSPTPTPPATLPVFTPSPTAGATIPTPTQRPATPTLLPATDTPVVSVPVCVPPGGDLEFGEADTFAAYQGLVLDLLNQGATNDQLDDFLYDAGVGNLPIIVDSADMTGDGQPEVVISLFDPDSDEVVPAGSLLIYVCDQEMYELAFIENSLEAHGAPHLWYLQDLDADGLAELVVSQPTCGASTCFERVQILAWTGETYENKLVGESNDLPFPDIRVSDEDGDGVYDLAVVGSSFGSVGAGPTRELTRSWVFIDSVDRWQVSGEELGPSNYRIHMVNDADQAAQQGDFSEAILLYQRVIRDTTLQDWQDPQLERANLAAYARYKLVVVYSLLDQLTFADTIFQELSDTYPVGSPQRGYVEMAASFQVGFADRGKAGGCEAAQTYARANAADVLAPLGVEAFGYGNQDYGAEDICP